MARPGDLRPRRERPKVRTWAGFGGGANAAVLAVAAAGLAVVLYYNRSIGRLARAFYGVRDAVARS